MNTKDFTFMTKEISLFVVIFAVVLALPPSLADGKCGADSTALIDHMYSIIIKNGENKFEYLRSLYRSLRYDTMAGVISKNPSISLSNEFKERLDDVNESVETLAQILQTEELRWLEISNEEKKKFKVVALSSGVYFFNKVLKTYHEAEATCRTFGLKLAYIKAEEDVLKVAAAAPTRGKYWISGNKNHQNCKMIDCKRNRQDSSSEYYPCNSTYYFICQVPSKC